MLRFLPLVLLLLAAAAARLVNLDVYTGKFDEGIRAEQLLLMEAGFRPVRDIFTAQGPLSLDVFYGPYLLLGRDLSAARLAVVVYSLVGIAAVWWVARQAAGGLAAFLAALLLVLSPLYLKNSRLALVEVPALVPATLAVGAALLYQRRGGRAPLVAAGALAAVALSVKPMALPAAAAAGLFVLLRPKRPWHDVALFGLVAAAVGLGICLLYGLPALLDQVLQYRLAAHRASGWSLRENWSIARQELVDESLAFYALALLGGLYAAFRHPRAVLPLVAWLVLSALLLAVYSPLQFKHVVILLPPLALLAGCGLVGAWRVESGEWRVRPPHSLLSTLYTLLSTSLAAWYLLTLPRAVDLHRQVIAGVAESVPESYAEEAALVAELAGPDELVVVDDPYLAYRARRLVPPALVDTSHYRIRSGALSASAAIADLERFDVRVLFLFSDGLRELGQRFEQYVDERYRAVRIYERPNGKDRALYLRDDADFAQARAVLTGGERPVGAEVGGQMRLVGYNLERDELRPGSSTTLTLHWESLAPMSVDWHVLTILRDARGREVLQTQRNMGGGGEGTASWEPGRWAQRVHILTPRPNTPPGEYALSVALYDSKARTSPPVTAGAPPGSAPNEVLLGTLRVRDRN